MCGIAGASFSDSQDAARVTAAVELMVGGLEHRGPDDRGVVQLSDGRRTPEAVIGNTRLSILDLSLAGHQPMLDPETGNWVVLNGEIYNHWELRRELHDNDGPWRSTGDTETLLKAYSRWGEACLGRLRGMFAFALWDARSRELWCVRDRLGIKPFYYFEGDGVFAFASEVRALLASGLVPHELDEDGLAGYMKFGSLPEPYTLVRNVASLGAGESMRVHGGTICRRQVYWAPAAVEPRHEPLHVAELRHELERAVREHLISDVPVATFLSGGVDSSVVTALAAQHAEKPIRTFTMRFERPDIDESEQARMLAERYSTVHQEVCLTAAQVLSEVPKAVASADLPSADGLNTYIVSQAVAEAGIKVVLSGLGGDEVFGGYYSFRLLPRLERFSPVLGRFPADLRRLRAGGRSEQATRRKVSFQFRYESMRAFWSEAELAALGFAAAPGFRPIDPGAAFTLVARAGVCEMQGYMRCTLLRDGDCMSMAHSLEMRVPLLDHQLVEFCLRHNAAGPGSKRWLLRAAADLLPRGMEMRPKRGFVLPMDEWMRGPLRDFVRDGLDAAVRHGALSQPSMRRLTAGFEQRRQRYFRLWQFVVLGSWLRRHGLALEQPLGAVAGVRSGMAG